MSAPSGTLIAYATAPGSTAADGYGRNGVYTKHILQQIRSPDMPAEIMFKRVREGVEQETLRRQTPWDASSLKGDFSFNSAARSRAGTARASAAPARQRRLALTDRAAVLAEREGFHPADEVQAYLDRYPKGTFAPLARSRLDALAKPTQRRVGGSADDACRARDSPRRAPHARFRQRLRRRLPDKPCGETRLPQSRRRSHADRLRAAPTRPLRRRPKVEPLPGREIAPGIREIRFPTGPSIAAASKGSLLHGKGEYVARASATRASSRMA
jgi:hypothetical protein